MAKITLNNTNSKCPYCEIKEYVNDWNHIINSEKKNVILLLFHLNAL